MCCVTPFPSFGEAPCRFFSGPLGGPGGHLHLLPQQEEADGPALEEEGVDGGPAFGVGSLHGPGQGLGRHLGLVQGKEDQAVGGGSSRRRSASRRYCIRIPSSSASLSAGFTILPSLGPWRPDRPQCTPRPSGRAPSPPPSPPRRGPREVHRLVGGDAVPVPMDPAPGGVVAGHPDEAALLGIPPLQLYRPGAQLPPLHLQGDPEAPVGADDHFPPTDHRPKLLLPVLKGPRRPST